MDVAQLTIIVLLEGCLKHYQREYAKQQNDPRPSVLGIDEHFFSRKQGFVTTFCDLKKS